MATFTPLDEDEATRLGARFGFGAPIKVTPIPAGSVNSNFRVDFARGACFLRIYEEQGFDGAEWDAALLDHLARGGVATPRPCSAVDGGPIAETAGKPVALFPFVDGVHACQRSVDRDRAFAVGRALADVHRVAASFPHRRAGRFTLDALRARLPKIAQAEDATLAAMAPILEEEIARWSSRRIEVPEGVVHGDLFRDNVLFRSLDGPSRAEIVALLDFESASDGRLLYDLAVTILAWCFGDAFDPSLARAMIDGYRGVRDLEPREREGLRAELAIAALRFTTTRITDYAMPRAASGERVIKDWRRFWARFRAVETLDLNAILG